MQRLNLAFTSAIRRLFAGRPAASAAPPTASAFEAMLGKLKTSSFRALASLFSLLILACGLTYSYYRIWEAHVQAQIVKPDPAGTEVRLILAAVLAAGATLVAAIIGWWDRRSSLRNEREKKALELKTEAAFDMWKAATSAYRLLEKAGVANFARPDSLKVSEGFENAEKGTLLFDDDLVLAFQILWQESERLTARLLPTAGAGPADQAGVWQEEVKAYAAAYGNLKDMLKSSVKA